VRRLEPEAHEILVELLNPGLGLQQGSRGSGKSTHKGSLETRPTMRSLT
jgi:hypothetical protein